MPLADVIAPAPAEAPAFPPEPAFGALAPARATLPGALPDPRLSTPSFGVVVPLATTTGERAVGSELRNNSRE